ncbi:MAG: hypothetical protein Q4B40_06695 [Clostridia bacterium]|nr:hypothetical protein [Clostridia bacterium]
MAIKTLNYTVTLDGVKPNYERRAGVQYDHNKTQIQFVLDDELYNKLLENLTDGSLHYRFDVYDGEGNEHLSEVYSLESIILKPFCLSYWVTKFGGKLKVDLVITMTNNNVTTTEFSTEISLALDDLPESDIDDSVYQSLTTLNLQTADYVKKMEKLNADVSDMHNEITDIKSMLEQGEWVFDSNSDTQIDVNFVVEDILDSESKNAVSNGSVTREMNAIKDSVKELNSDINQKVYDAIYEKMRDEILLEAYPIGSYYWSSESTNPTELFGGSWQPIKDVFLFASGDEYVANITGGEAMHMLTTDEMPKHGHLFNPSYQGTGVNFVVPSSKGTGTSCIKVEGNAYSPGHWASLTWGTDKKGSSMAHNNMPPFLTAYCFKRIG